MIEGLLVIDKPSGPTSHDVVVRMRRVLRERRIGHTGTLDPLATGVLPLVIGRATRLARFLSGSDKSYDAVVRLGTATDTGDREGSTVSLPFTGQLPTKDVIDREADAFRGQFLQQPPAISAKKIGGQRSYDLARGRSRDGVDSVPTPSLLRPGSVPGPSPLRPQPVTVTRLLITAVEADLVTLTVDCSAGFYVRALAHDLGERLGTGAHLVALRRTRVGELTVTEALAVDSAACDDRAAVAARVIPLSRMLTHLPTLTLDRDAVRRAIQGRDLESRVSDPIAAGVRLLDEAGDLVAIAEPSLTRPGLLHPSVVLK